MTRSDDLSPLDVEAVKVLIAHTRTDITGCHCGWGSHAGNMGQSHALHVWRELQSAVLPDHDARVRAPLEVARIVTRHWHQASLGKQWQDPTAHVLGIVLSALDGETDPAELGIPDGHPDAAAIARQHATTGEDT